MQYRQSHPNPQDREILFHLTDSVTGLPKTGQTFATTDLQLRKPGAGVYVNCNATQQASVVEIGSGDYVYTFTQPELDTPGPGLAFKTNKAGTFSSTDRHEVVRAYIGSVIAGTLTPTLFTSDRAESIANHWKNALLLFLTGALAGQVQKVSGYTVAGGAIAFTTGFTGAPAVGDIFEFIDR